MKTNLKDLATLPPEIVRDILNAMRGQIPQKGMPQGIPILQPTPAAPGQKLNFDIMARQLLGFG